MTVDLLHGEDPISIIDTLATLAREANWIELADLLDEAQDQWAAKTND